MRMAVLLTARDGDTLTTFRPSVLSAEAVLLKSPPALGRMCLAVGHQVALVRALVRQLAKNTNDDSPQLSHSSSARNWVGTNGVS
jgi:hypothetical protein